MPARAALAAVLLAAAAAHAAPFRAVVDHLSFELPEGWRGEPATDIVAPHALKVTPPGGAVSSLVLLVGGHKVTEAQLEAEAEKWHQAHQRNRVAWGMRAAGGLPAEQLHVGGKKAVRYRDRVGSAVGRGEQTLVCLVHGGRLVCALALHAPAAREEADGLVSTLLASARRR